MKKFNLLLALLVASCNLGLDKIYLKRILRERIEIEWYSTSSITDVRTYVEVILEDTVFTIYDGNGGDLEDVYLHFDTVVLDFHSNRINDFPLQEEQIKALQAEGLYVISKSTIPEPTIKIRIPYEEGKINR